METNQQVRTNAAISYFFLGFLFLLAKRNPNFAEPFVRMHAKSATKIHLFLLAYIVLHRTLLSQLLAGNLPVVWISLGRVFLLAAFILEFALLIHGAYRAFCGEIPKNALSFSSSKESLELSGVSGESEIVKTLLSFVPFIGPYVSERHVSPLISLWVRISGLATFVLLSLSVFFTGENLFLIVLFCYTVLFVSVGASLLTRGSLEYLAIFDAIPSLWTTYRFFRTLPRYALDILQAVAGKRETLDFQGRLAETAEADLKFEKELSVYFDGSTGPFSAYLIYVPFLNLVFLPKFFAPGKNPFVLAIWQGITLTIAMATIAYFYGISSPLLSLSLLPISLGMATVKTRPFYRIIGLYEVYSLLSFCTFGLVSGSKLLKSKAREEKSVNYKV